MKLRFIVLLAIVCLCAHAASAHDKAKPEKAEKSEKVAKPEKEKFETDTEEIEITRTKTKKEHEKKEKKEKKKIIVEEVIHHKKEPKPKKVQKSCAEITLPNKEECEKSAPEGYKAVFSVKEDAHCTWGCNYEALPTPEPPKAPEPPKPVKKVKKVKKEKKKRAECAGDKKIHFSNCLVKVNGLIAWGAETANFDKKFEKFLAKAKAPKKGAKKAKAKKV